MYDKHEFEGERALIGERTPMTTNEGLLPWVSSLSPTGP